MSSVTVCKLDHTGRQVFAYPGKVLQREGPTIVLRTAWDRDPLDVGYVVLEPGDRWTEYFFSDRWYNIFEIRAEDGHLKGWYCNIARPANIDAHEVSAEDLALDLWVAPDGEMLVLDEDEFAALPLSPIEREAALDGLAELQKMVIRKAPPFDGSSDSEESRP
jgi:predicted RNA-binding protein associated with RNAse of E/G family